MLTMIDPEAAHRVLVQLSALLRTTLDRSAAAEVALSEEIDFMDRYLAIEQIRFQDRLRVDISADDDALSAVMPNLILQPLVENAVRHGIARRRDARCLTIRGARRSGSLVLEVEDDGPGLPGDGPHAAGRQRRRASRTCDHGSSACTANRRGWSCSRPPMKPVVPARACSRA